MNYNQFNNILFESKLGRNEIKRAFLDLNHSLGYDEYIDRSLKQFGINNASDLKNKIKNKINQRRELAFLLSKHRNNINSQIKKDLLKKQKENNYDLHKRFSMRNTSRSKAIHNIANYLNN